MTTFAMTKLVVADLDKAVAFYAATCGLKEARRIKGGTGGRAMTEVIMAGQGAAATLVLMTYTDGGPAPTPGECILVFETDDIEAFFARAVAAGASIAEPITRLPDFGLSFGFLKDPEGHLVEGLQRHPPKV